MWLWILSALFLLLVWGLWFVLAPLPGTPEPEIFPTWLAVTITAVVVLALVGIVLYRRVRSRRAARALEKAIAQQAQEQVLAAKPENRAEVQELQRRMLEGITSLKRSSLGESGDALYSLPWYAIVGPPGAGKTTALRYSGLSFPYLDPDNAAVRGVGGTRNCDWWFTNEAILLDTAGRYTTQSEDRDEWVAFLDMLRQYRTQKPLNGVIVAVSVSELLDATEAELQTTAERVRDRIDEMQERLHMVLPVYVLFTKCDLIAGFSEFFGDLKRSERGQLWGATLDLKADKSKVGKLFDAEFDLLVTSLHQRTLRRIGIGRGSRAEKERVYQFPLEFAAIKHNLSQFMDTAFRPTAAAPTDKKAKIPKTPILRGFYFTSGTQEGKPLDRVVGAMGRAFGLRAVEREAPAAATEAKSFFLKDVFERVVFPDRDIAALTEEEVRRARLKRFAMAAAAMLFASALLFPAISSFVDNRALVEDTARISRESAALDWTEGDVLPKIEQLDALRAHLEKLDQWNSEGAPVSMRWGMYQGEKLFEPAVAQYIAALRDGFIAPVKGQLEGQLKRASGTNYLEEYEALKTYLLLGTETLYWTKLSDLERWQVARLTREWAIALREQAGSVSEADLRDKIVGHVSYYVSLRKRSINGSPVQGEELNPQVVAFARDALTRVGEADRYYKQFVDALAGERIDPKGPDTLENLKYPPLTLNSMFADREQALTVLSSRKKKRDGKYQEVRGQYTFAGHEAVIAGLNDGFKILEREQWVVPLTEEEKRQPDRIKKALDRVRQDYDNQYVTEWTDFFRDIDVKVPQNNVEAIDEFKVLATADWPYSRLLKALRDNTQFDKVANEQADAKVDESKGGVIDQLRQRARRKIDAKFRTPGVSQLLTGGGPGGAAAQVDPIPKAFEKMVEFGFPNPPKEGEPPPPSGLGGYIGDLEQLAAEMQVLEEGPPNGDTKKATQLFEKAVAEAEKRLLSLDATGQRLMRDLLLNPLRQSYKAMLKSAGGAASGLWEVTVWPPYKDTIQGRYPFNSSSRRDASYEDFVAFYKPKDGILWGFYETYLKDFHMKVGHRFVPATHLQGSQPARRYTPFNTNLYNCLERSDEISDALFHGNADPKLSFNVSLTTVSPIVSEIVFELDGVQRVYKNEKEFWKGFEWPGPAGPTGASIRIRGAGGLDEELRRDGPWGFFRLLEAGRHTAEKDDDKVFRVEWEMSAPPVIVQMKIRPQRKNHPFPVNFFRNSNCPQSIGDNFGG
ncbi:MAG: type VI secretion system membrane subunit TssM [Deltaproteobacteria bacterium]|nr:type VI secretion system membrane subunit TssM [Deltaproteobacteria bacterium]